MSIWPVPLGQGGPGGPGSLAEVLLVTLDGFLDAEQHGGQPLVQPRDAVILLHLWGRGVGAQPQPSCSFQSPQPMTHSPVPGLPGVSLALSVSGGEGGQAAAQSVLSWA